MAKSEVESKVEFLKPSLFDALKQELLDLEKVEPGSRTTKEVIQELLPLIKGCRARGHSWQRITGSFQKYLPGLTIGTLRKLAYELEPALKGTAKGVNSTQATSSAVPEFEEEEDEISETEDDVWPPADVEDNQEDEDEDEEETSEPEITITSGRRSKV